MIMMADRKAALDIYFHLDRPVVQENTSMVGPYRQACRCVKKNDTSEIVLVEYKKHQEQMSYPLGHRAE